MSSAEPVDADVPAAKDMRDLGARLARLLRPGDLVLLSGDLGAGKTTLTQGIAAGLGVRGPVTSPTFVIAREHAPSGREPVLVHADAYRLGGVDELDDLDLETAAEDAVTVVEWGEGIAEGLSDDRLEVTVTRRRSGSGAAGPRRVRVVAVGPRWAGADLRSTVTGAV